MVQKSWPGNLVSFSHEIYSNIFPALNLCFTIPDRGRRTALIDGIYFIFLVTYTSDIITIIRYGNCCQLSSVCWQVLQISSFEQPNKKNMYKNCSQPVGESCDKLFIIIVYYRWFERITMTVILINCITLGMYKPCADTNICDKKCLILKV